MNAPAGTEDRTGRPWTADEIRFAQRTDLPTHEIAQMLRRSYTAVTSMRSRARTAATS